MAPLKRSRADREEIIDVQTASSSLQQDIQRKKARTTAASSSKARNVRDESPSSSSDDESIRSTEDDTPMLASTQYEIMRDAGFVHLQNPDLDDQIATQMLNRRLKDRAQQIGDNRAADNAIIQEITCINFMCHEKLHVELGPLINFVVGMNGSGKSAVLTAITLCLGGKASATNRGASIKSLIKSGQEKAVLTIKLKNEGDDAFQPDVYGKSIIVERYFSRTGASGYKLKNELGRVISSKKGDVDDIVEYYQLQVDNPMNVLTQDDAKKFITASTPKDKYKFFWKGVQLEQLDNDYKLVSETCDQMGRLLENQEQDLKELEKKRDQAEEKKRIVDQHEDLRSEWRRLGKLMAWAQVEEQEGKLREREETVVNTQDKIEQQQRNIEAKDQHYRLSHEKLERASEALDQLQTELDPLKEEELEFKTSYDKAQAELKNAHAQQRQIGTEIKSAQQKVESIKKSIAVEERRIEEANGGSHARVLAKIEEAMKKAAEAAKTLEESSATQPRLDQERQEAFNAVERAEVPRKEKQMDVTNLKKKLADLNNRRPNPLAGYDGNFQRLLQAIQQDSGFSEKPVGPMGLHVKLLSPEWSDILESVLGNALNGFVVTNKQDQVRLQALMRQFHLGWAPIFIGNAQPIDTSRNEPDPAFKTILRVLEIDNQLVKNQLIINQGIDQMLLIEDRQEAYNTMVSGRPHNVKKCFCINKNKRGYGIVYSRQGTNMNNDFTTPRNQAARMKTDTESNLVVVREELKKSERELAELENNYRLLKQQYQETDHAAKQHKQAQTSLKRDVQKADDHVETLEAELDKTNVEDGKLDALKEELADAEADVRMYQDTYGNAGIEKDKLNEVASTQKRALATAKERLAEHETKIKKAETKVRNLKDATQLAVEDKNTAVELVEELMEQKAAAEQRVRNQADRVKQFEEQAVQICPRVPIPDGQTATTIDVRLTKVKEQIQLYRKKVGADDRDINEAFERAIQVYDSAKIHYDHMQELLQTLKESFASRMKQFRQFQKFISARSRINFNYLLSERAFRGKLTIDHRAKKLDVHVEPDETSKNAKGRQAKTLSGGEKSFSSICLLLSLWEAMGAPLRCLDEFDVYMDDVNRDVSTRMIISAARRSVGRQFILITPKALGNGAVEEDGKQAPDVHIIKLFDPRIPRVDQMMEDE